MSLFALILIILCIIVKLCCDGVVSKLYHTNKDMVTKDQIVTNIYAAINRITEE